MERGHKRLKYACYTTNVTMSVVGNFSPVLFLTFRNLYGISYSLLGLLVLVNFFTQLTVDLIFSFFSHKFNIQAVVKLTPAIATVGLIVYALAPWYIASAPYVGILIGTIIFSASSGLAEVLISPVIAAIPSENPEREMSKLHSVYAWGVVAVVLISTVFLRFVGSKYWQWLALFFTLIPLSSCLLFLGAEVPKMQTPERTSGTFKYLKTGALWLCVIGIFLGGASEVTMAQWASSYLEQALGIPKVWGDVFGVALFSVALGLGRSLYAKYGKNVRKVLLLGAIGATACYLTAALCNVPIVGLLACALTGFCTSMLWPGSLVVASDRFPTGGVFIYAMMAAGGDLGASVAPQLVGVITDTAIKNETLIRFAASLSLTPEQFGMKLGLLAGAIFPLIAIVIFSVIMCAKKTGEEARPLQNADLDKPSA